MKKIEETSRDPNYRFWASKIVLILAFGLQLPFVSCFLFYCEFTYFLYKPATIMLNLQTSFKNYRKRSRSSGLSSSESHQTCTLSSQGSESVSPKLTPKAQQTITETNIPRKGNKKFKILYRKFSNKKNKTWEGDGELILNLSSNIATIKNEDDIVIGKLKEADKVIYKGVFKCHSMEFELDDEIFYSKEPKLNLSAAPKSLLQNQPIKISKNISTSKPFVSPIIRKQAQIFSSEIEKSTPITLNSTVTPNSIQKSVKTKKKQAHNNEPLYDIGNVQNPLFMPDLPVSIDMSEKPRKVVVDPSLSVKLRPHQRDGVTFLYSCLMGLKSDDIRGAILADEMGLGKTLQTITLIWTLLRQSPIADSKPVINKVLICCPVSLVSNWKNEFTKWLGLNRVNVLTINSNKYQNEKQDIELFGRNNVYQVMIIGYEKMQSMSEYLSQVKFDLLVCDEGHRLKTGGNKTMKTLESFNIRRRILLSGTPIQNDLVEFYTMAHFTNPGIFGELKNFQKEFIKTILDSRDSNCTNTSLINKGKEKSKELVKISNKFILRRSNLELTKYLPKRSDYIILVPPSSLQLQLFETIMNSDRFKNTVDDDDETSSSLGGSFNLITTFRKLCNSPSLLKDDDFFLEVSGRKSNSLDDVNFRQQLSKKVKSGKLIVLIKLLGVIHSNGDEKVVVVSNFTATLNIIEALFKSLNLEFLRLDGSTPSNERSKIVDKFNKSDSSKVFALLLSAKAGGTGLNLVGASRIILFDNDWNPAVDLQAIARIHRDGQKREVKTYRLLTNGCIDEKIFQRQLVKQDLSDRFVDQKGGEKELFDRNELKDIFNVQLDKLKHMNYCNTHEMMMCDCKGDGSVMINGRYYNDSSDDEDNDDSSKQKDDDESDSDDNEESRERKKEIMNFMSALTYSQKYPKQNEKDQLQIMKRTKIRRCLKGYRHINPLDSDCKFIETDDSLLNILLNGQDKEKPLISFVFGKY